MIRAFTCKKCGETGHIHSSMPGDWGDQHWNDDLCKECVSMGKCFRCGVDIEPAAFDSNVWDCPGGAVYFKGGWNFGSTLYDADYDGIHVELLVCDDCLKTAKEQGLMREVDNSQEATERREKDFKEAMKHLDLSKSMETLQAMVKRVKQLIQEFGMKDDVAEILVAEGIDEDVVAMIKKGGK